MTARTLTGALDVLLCAAGPAFAGHHGSSTHFFGLTWGHSAPQSFGSSGQSFGVSPFGVAPFGVAPFGVVPFGTSTFGSSAFGVSPFGVSPFGVSPFGASPFGTRPPTDAEIQGVQDWL